MPAESAFVPSVPPSPPIACLSPWSSSTPPGGAAAGVFRRPKAKPARLDLPLYGQLVAAGFPSPADDYIEELLDLNELLVRNPPATFYVRLRGRSMIAAGLHDGDILVVDRSIEARTGNVVVATVDGGYTVKRLYRRGRRVELRPDSDERGAGGLPLFKAIELQEGQELLIFGVVVAAVKQLPR